MQHIFGYTSSTAGLLQMNYLKFFIYFLRCQSSVPSSSITLKSPTSKHLVVWSFKFSFEMFQKTERDFVRLVIEMLAEIVQCRWDFKIWTDFIAILPQLWFHKSTEVDNCDWCPNPPENNEWPIIEKIDEKHKKFVDALVKICGDHKKSYIDGWKNAHSLPV